MEGEREGLLRVPELCTLRHIGLMNLCQAQSEPRHYATNFSIIVLFVNQCLFITDAITVAACFLFFFPRRLNNHSLLLLSHPSSQLTSVTFWESLNGLTMRRQHFYLQSAGGIAPSLPNRGEELRHTAHTHTPPARHQNRNSLA